MSVSVVGSNVPLTLSAENPGRNMGMFNWLFGKHSRRAGAATGMPTPSALAASVSEAPAPFFAIIDVETTGLSPQRDRIIELALIRVDDSGEVIDHWSTRLDPEGPVGATHIHGITQADVDGQPRFRELAASLASHLAGIPVVAHNAPFDLAFLRAEFRRAGWDIPRLPAYCTLDGSRNYLPTLDRRRLADCCWAAGVPLEGAHSALGDALATAGLLSYYLRQANRSGSRSEIHAVHAEARAVVWPDGPTLDPITVVPGGAERTRTARPPRYTAPRPKQPPLLRQLTDLSLLEALDEGAPEGSIVYLETVLNALEDGEITDEEAALLADLTRAYNLSDDDRDAAHRALLLALAHKAVDDGHVSHDERAELHHLAGVLNVPDTAISELISRADAARKVRMSGGLKPLPDDWALGEPLRVGHKVAFTGCDDRQRARLEKRAEELGVRVMGNVSRLTAMLITDGTMDGTKLAKATAVGTRIVHPDVFEVLLGHLQPALPTDAVRRPPAPARPTQSKSPEAPQSGSETAAASPTMIRSWALANGYEIGVRGRIAANIVDAYRIAHIGPADAGSTN